MVEPYEKQQVAASERSKAKGAPAEPNETMKEQSTRLGTQGKLGFDQPLNEDTETGGALSGITSGEAGSFGVVTSGIQYHSDAKMYSKIDPSKRGTESDEGLSAHKRH